MKTLPNYENARIDIKKLRDYCLNPDHPVGKHKARVFKSALNITRDNAQTLKQDILNALSKYEVSDKISDKYGTRYIVNIKIHILGDQADICTIWIIKREEDFPRLVTCYVQN